MKSLIKEISSCRICSPHLPHEPRPVVSLGKNSKILIIGQAPGQKVHDSGIPWNDKSGDELRRWLNVDKEQFYNPEIFGIMPMGFCFPGRGASGDLPPRPECAVQWHARLLSAMKSVQLTLLIGHYAQAHYLKDRAKSTLTETVQNFNAYLPTYFPLVHPSPRNNIWQRKNQWFQTEVVPELRKAIEPFL